MEQRLDRELPESSRAVWLRKSRQLGRRALLGVLQGEGEVRVKCFGESGIYGLKFLMAKEDRD